MLPEFLFSVGSSMQDISREEFSLMNGGCDKESTRITCNESPLDNIKLGRIPDHEPVSIKIEEPDIYSWNSSTDIGSNLLRHSDDPLISGGAIDDTQNEFNPITNCDTAELSPIVPKKKSTRTRRKGQFKLRFHHQALPQEYLDHYEASQINLQKKEVEQNKRITDMEANDHLKAVRTHESVRNWLQKISEYQTKSASSPPPPKPEIPNEIATNAGQSNKKAARVVSYNDLPYMGEMTLDNSKPRRGRKPKKADICHLIYKNYGTILPGTPKDQHVKNCDKTVSTVPADLKKAETQTKIMSSLLEKRLTHESKRLSPSIVSDDNLNVVRDAKHQIEPLNLCLRDRSDTLTLSSDDESDTLLGSTKTSPLISPTPSETDAFLAANLKTSLLSDTKPPGNQPEISETASTIGSDGQNSGYVFWPPAGVFIHPMALYYQKMVDSGKSLVATTNTTTTPTTPSTVSSTPSPMLAESPSVTPKSEPSVKILIPKNISDMLKQEPSTTTTADIASHSSKSTTPVPQKRKRSAIFIPPMPLETSSSHATEVSICKFKFTGGAKPSLQEKKMLSVDSGGNFRYYSGTGDKSMRGYEFFPRESLQQSSLLTDSSSGAFLNTPGEKISLDLPPPSHGLSNELLQIPEILNPNVSVIVPPPTSVQRVGHSSVRKKRKSRRSVQRENLEKTFKEKGFLIQTQQLESAEGATYCKFRQLRKFTRYLFRSWKDYLPGELQSEQATGNDAQGATSQSRMIASPATTPCLEQSSSSME
ncbi:uncharacterized protein LOC119071725 isoform X1 [Bradysia coprophila]|uniref:uncharacterized protein LOC119071725 isoform X1 n=2 Tax=Bradysia coprophila TaxID=38358 RepID=UPI00187DBBD2|nr:uncharacterized protein LOC119071725 isoform X1 [Bradysia coprophila]